MSKQQIEHTLIALYTRNEEYHDSKDHLIWLAGSVYLGFSVAVLAWLFDHKCLWMARPLILAGLLFGVFAPAFVFVGLENWQKCQSVTKTGLFENLIRALDKPKKLTYSDLMQRTDPKGRIYFWCDFFRNGWPGAIILSVMAFFFVVQMLVLFKVVSVP